MAKRTRDSESSSSSDPPGSESESPRTKQKKKKSTSKNGSRKDQKRKSRKGSSSGPHADHDSDGSDSDADKPKPEPIDKEYGVAARAVARCVDLFCQPRKVVDYILLLDQEEAAKKGELDESERERERRHQLLRAITKKQQERYQRAYDMFVELAPGLKDLINNPSKRNELQHVLSGMKKAMTGVRADDCSGLKERIGRYVPVNPSKDTVSPPIHNGQSSRSHLGFNHPILARFLCPVSHLTEFDKDPQGTRQNLLNGKIKVLSEVFPAFIWSGEPPGVNFDEGNMLEGMFEGYFLGRVMRHIFRGASSAFGEEPTGSRSCNAELHAMNKVVAPNIAYASLQARFNISAKNRWSEKDGAFNYRLFYYAVLDTIEDCADQEWMNALLRFHNRVVFDNENGREDSDSTDGSADKNGTSRSPSDSFLARLRAQAAARASAANQNGHEGTPTNDLNVAAATAASGSDASATSGNATNDRNAETSHGSDNPQPEAGGEQSPPAPAAPSVPPRFASISNAASGSVNGTSSSVPPTTGTPTRPLLADVRNSTPLTGKRGAEDMEKLSDLSECEDSEVLARKSRAKGKGKASQVLDSSNEATPPAAAQPKKQKKAPKKAKTRK